jgi:hypothetical protein
MPCLPTDVPKGICLLSVYLEDREDRSEEVVRVREMSTWNRLGFMSIGGRLYQQC